VFSIAGRQSHGEGEALRSIVIVAAPFVVAWLVVAWFSGVYRSSSLRRVALAWLVAWPIALALRALTGRGVPVSFDLVALLFCGALLLGWRAVVSRLAR
jgi:hypothetical protein